MPGPAALSSNTTQHKIFLLFTVNAKDSQARWAPSTKTLRCIVKRGARLEVNRAGLCCQPVHVGQTANDVDNVE